MPARRLTAVDRLLSGVDNALRTVVAPAGRAARENPATGITDGSLDAHDVAHSAGLMRVNHAGEVAAQALYQGHALVARDPSLEAELRSAAAEEFDHLAWCEERLSELAADRSRLSPLWYAGSYLIGAVSGLFGDRLSLGFIAETERQVCEHLDRHFRRLPDGDARSRAIIGRMREEEAVHGEHAVDAGAISLPAPVRKLMRLSSRVMTTTAYWI